MGVAQELLEQRELSIGKQLKILTDKEAILNAEIEVSPYYM
jgi:hypothetical protein